MEHLQGWWNMDIRWHHYKHCRIPNLTLPCWRARRDDRIGYLDHPIQSPDAKVMQITSFGLVFCRDCRPAGLSWPCTFAKHILPCHKTTRDPPMDPYELDIQVNTKAMTGRLPPWIGRPQLVANSIKFSESKCGWLVMTIHNTMEVDWMNLVDIPGRPAPTLAKSVNSSLCSTFKASWS